MILKDIFSFVSCHLAEFLYITKIARLCMKLFLSCKRLYVKVDTFTTCFPTVMHIFMKVFELDLQGTKENQFRWNCGMGSVVRTYTKSGNLNVRNCPGFLEPSTWSVLVSFKRRFIECSSNKKTFSSFCDHHSIQIGNILSRTHPRRKLYHR